MDLSAPGPSAVTWLGRRRVFGFLSITGCFYARMQGARTLNIDGRIRFSRFKPNGHHRSWLWNPGDKNFAVGRASRR